MTDGTTVALVFGGLAAAINIGLIVWRGGALASSLESMRTAQDAATAESKRQHEETRGQIAALREHRVASDATAEHQRADLDALREAVREIREEQRRAAADIVETRHTLRSEWQTALNALTREPTPPKRTGR